MEDKSVKKVSSGHSPRGEMGQKYLATGKEVSMRLWDGEEPDEPKPEAAREYETVGYVVEGRAELHLEGQMVLLEPGAPGWCPKAPRIRTRSSNPSPPSRRRARQPRSVTGTSRRSGERAPGRTAPARHPTWGYKNLCL